MLKVGDIIHCLPDVQAPHPPTKATIIYIHPLGRYYTVEFTGPTGATFRESRYFTSAELEEAYNLGIFPRPQEEILFDPKQQRREQQSQQWRKNHRPVEEPDYDDEYDISTIMAMA